MKRRAVIIAATGVVPFSRCSLSPSESGNIQIANQTEQEVWKEISIQSEGGLFSNRQTVYDRRTRQPPTASYRSTVTDVVPPGNYEVTVASKQSRRSNRAILTLPNEILQAKRVKLSSSAWDLTSM
jgi:hypothetical protein